MINTDKFFNEAERRQVAPFELTIDIDKAIEIKLFDGKLEEFNISENTNVYGRGLVEGRMGAFSSHSMAKNIPEMMISHIIESAAYGQEVTHPLFVSKGLKYKRLRNYHRKLEGLNNDKLTEIAAAVHKGAAQIAGISQIEVQISVVLNEAVKRNSLGLKLGAKQNYVILFVSMIAKEGEQVESGYRHLLITDLDGFDPLEFGKQVSLETIKKLNGKSIKSGKYDIVLKEECVASLLRPLLAKLSAFDIQHGVSLFKDTLGHKKLSAKLTVDSRPISQSIFSSSYDDEGTPKQNMKLIKGGVVMNYLYDLNTAYKDGVESNGCGSRNGSNVRPALDYIAVRPGKKTFEEIVAKMGEGIYITELQGLHAGLDSTSGNFSLQAAGFLIREGKIDRPLSLITVAGNLLTLFDGILYIGSEVKETVNMALTPVIAFKKVAISGSEN